MSRRWPDADLGGTARAVGWRLPARGDDQSAWADHLGWQATCQVAAIDDYLAETRAAAVRVAALARGGATR